MTALGYERAAPATREVFYASRPRADWPRGAEQAPWHGDVTPPGSMLWVKYERLGPSTLVTVRVRPLCAIVSAKKSRRDKGPEHMLAVFSAVQVFSALNGHLDTALRPYE